MKPLPPSPTLLTVEIEDYFQVGRFEHLIQREKWHRFETRIERNTRRTLDLLDRFGIRATFFVLGWLAENLPELVQEIVGRGHEVASLGYDRRTIGELTPSEFRENLARSKEALERASGRRVRGHRVPHYLGPSDLWALDVLAEEGYAYDSSLRPIFWRFATEPWRRRAHLHRAGDKTLWELPLSAWNGLGFSVPIAGAGYFRHYPQALISGAVRRWHETEETPFVMYFRAWELDPDQPRIEAVSPLARLRHYRNLDKMANILEGYFRTYPAIGIADYLGIDTVLENPPRPSAETARRVPAAGPASEPATAAKVPKTGVSVVVPCFNEEDSLTYLSNTLRSLETNLGDAYDFFFLLVDDGSRDGTWESLLRVFGGRPDCTLLRHDRNRGVAAAILTGLRASPTEIACSIDCDCTYDPLQLGSMIPLLVEGVDMVSASPYHPQGQVRNVPSWRLALSRGAAFLYRRVLRQKLYTSTSCFRVYRRSAVVDVELRHGGFLGVAELLGILDLRGSRIVEHPAVLEVRVLGRSKMETLRTIGGHLRLLARLLALRLQGGGVSKKGGVARSLAGTH